MAHGTHSDVVNRLKRAEGHLRKLIEMIESRRECLDVAQQLHAIEKAIQNAKKVYIHDHIDNCIDEVAKAPNRRKRDSLELFKEIAKYL